MSKADLENQYREFFKIIQNNMNEPFGFFHKELSSKLKIMQKERTLKRVQKEIKQEITDALQKSDNYTSQDYIFYKFNQKFYKKMKIAPQKLKEILQFLEQNYDPNELTQKKLRIILLQEFNIDIPENTKTIPKYFKGRYKQKKYPKRLNTNNTDINYEVTKNTDNNYEVFNNNNINNDTDIQYFDGDQITPTIAQKYSYVETLFSEDLDPHYLL